MSRTPVHTDAKIILTIAHYLQEPEHPADKVFFEGHYWIGWSQNVWSLVLECCKDQVRRRLSKVPGVIAISAEIDGRKRYLIRYVDPKTKAKVLTERDRLKRMKALWDKHCPDRPLNGKDYGGLKKLVRVWPSGQSVEIFDSVLSHWHDYRDGAFILINAKKDAGENPRFFGWKVLWPNVCFIAEYPEPAIELHGFLAQAKKHQLGGNFKKAYLENPMEKALLAI